MKNLLLLCSMGILMLSSCSKHVDIVPVKPITANGEFIIYTILKGQQSCDKNAYTKVEYDQLKFIARFDSSAIYTTIDPLNQKDVNKLLGFSDANSNHHQHSARFGWRWSNNALRLFAYVYNNGVLQLKEMGTVQIGADIHCSIKIIGNEYEFTLNDKTERMPRSINTPKAIGYKLYPYFGGNEMAPHQISIWLKEIL